MSTGLQIAVALLLVGLNGFFVAAEFALVKVRATRLAELAAGGRPAARMALHAIHRLDVYLSASQVGISLASIALGRVGEPVVAHLLEPVLRAMALPESALHPVAFAVSISLVTAVHIVIGEQAPKSWAIRQSERASLALAYPLHWFYLLFRPAIWTLNGAATLLLRLLRIAPATEQELAHSEEELRLLLQASGRSGFLKESEVDLVRHVFEFANRTAGEIMVPRVDMVYLDAARPFEHNLAIVRAHTYTRYPLCEEDADHVLGMVHVKDLHDLEARRAAGEAVDLRTIQRDILIVPESKSIDRLLREFQQRKLHMAIVADEYGGTAGLVTLEDVLEQIVGEIHDEFEEPLPEVQALPGGALLVDGKTLLAHLRAEYGIELPPYDSETIGGWVLDHLGSIPEPGTLLRVEGYTLEVREVAGQRVRKVLLTPTEERLRAEAAGEAGAPPA